MLANYDISLATLKDVAGVLTLQEPNLLDNGGSLSVRQPADWFKRAVGEKSLIVARRNGKVVGYVLGTSLAAKAQVPIIQSMLRHSHHRLIAIFMARPAWPKVSAEKASPAQCSKNYKPIWAVVPR